MGCSFRPSHRRDRIDEPYVFFYLLVSMILPPNMSPSSDSEGNLIVPRYGIRTAMLLALVAVSSFCLFTFLGDKQWHQHHPGAPATRTDPIGFTAFWIALPLLPLIFSMWLLSRRSEEAKATGAGVAAGLFVCGSLAAVVAFLAQFLSFFPDPYGLENLVAILVFAVSSVWIVISAFRIAARAGWGVFFLAGGATLVWVIVGGHFLENKEYELGRQYDQQQSQTLTSSVQTNEDAHRVLALLAVCLIQYRATHSDAGFPASLKTLPHDLQLPQGTVCNPSIADAASVPGYTFTYSPMQQASSSGFCDFLLAAMPLKKGVPHVDPMAVDSRGRIFSYICWSVTDQQPKFVPALTEIPNDFQNTGILSLREDIRLFMQANGGTPPATLSKMSQYSDKSEYSDTLTDRWYRLEYFPPTAAAPKAYVLSAVCQNYGDACIRSFLIDQDGDIHQTSEPRQPTTRDALIPDCEKYAQTCRDIDWPTP